MKVRFTVLAVFLLLFSMYAFAAPCVNATLEDYIALGAQGCTFNGVHVANFSYDFVPPATPAHLVLVRLFSNTDTAQFKFMGLWRAKAGESLHAVVKYTVALPKEPVTSRAQVSLNLGPTLVSPTGSAEVDEATEVAKLSVFEIKKGTIIRAKWVAFMDFAPASALKTVQDTLTLDGGTTGGEITYFFNNFDPTANF